MKVELTGLDNCRLCGVRQSEWSGMTLGFLTQAIGRCHSLREQEVGVEVLVSDDVWFATVELNILVERGS